MASTKLSPLQRDELSPGDAPNLNKNGVQEKCVTSELGTQLNSSWTFWIDKPSYGSSAAEYEANLRELYNVSYAEKFWSVYNNIPQPSQISNRYSYHLMREGSKPIWEDASHCNGGHWKLKCQKKDSDEVWRELLLAAIGEKLSECLAEGDSINGVSISVRDRDDVVQIWNTNACLADKATVINRLQQLLPRVEFLTSFYKAFESHDAFEGKR
ncbi:eukaryotic translation initiation factor 4E type 3-like [Watersipora subatra]|uniref:eukaryotic translation initiation factor 4E type 3-like n=1 Tax=Watersipora subatra TaxID=2589382 RepID=UPI00355B72F5